MPVTVTPDLLRPVTLGRRAAAALVGGFATAAVAHAATVLLFFVVNGAATANLLPISDYFAPSTLVLFVLAALAAFAGGLRHRPLAALVGLVAAGLAALAGTSYGIVAGGTAWTPDAFGFVAASLAGTNLLFLALAALAAATVGRWAYLRLATLARRPVALVRLPSSRLDEGELTHLDRVPVDGDLADTQWEAYVAALDAAGFETVEVPHAEDFPDSVFIEDAVVVFGGTAVVTSPGAESRRGEAEDVVPIVRRLGLRVRSIELPGTLDGGDVLKVGSTVYVGRGGRTNGEGIRQLREIVAPLGFTVVPVPVTKVLHLKSAVTALPDGTVVGFADHVDAPAAFDRFLALPEPGAAVVVLSADTVLMAASVPSSIALVESLGYTVVAVDVSEFEKLEGCVTCLSVRIR